LNITLAGNFAGQLTGGGCAATLGKALSIQAQVGACEVQMVVDGRAISRSSRVPARTK